MNRFSKGRRSINALPILLFVFVGIIIIFLYGVNFMDTSTKDRQEQALRSAMERDIVHCYALEGFYPPSLDYIVEHYGLSYDEDIFLVDYQPIGDNIYPDYTIMLKGVSVDETQK